MAKEEKKSDHIRVRPIDKKLWKEYCSALGKNSPDLFNKIMTSEKLDLNKKMLEELRKKEEVLKRKANF